MRFISSVLRVYMWLYRFIKRPTYERVRALVVCDKQILLVRHMGGNGEWTLPGGGARKSETWEVALKRELREELDIEADILDFLLTVCDTQRFHTHIAHCFQVEVADTAIKPSRLELLDAGWFDPSQLPELSVVAKQALEAKKRHLKTA